MVQSPQELEQESQQAQEEDGCLAMDQQPTDSLPFSDDGSDWGHFDDWGEFSDWGADEFAELFVREEEPFFIPQSYV